VRNRPRETKWAYDNTRRAFTITSLEPIGAGCQVYDSYGQKCNHRFLLNYGFAIENNREADGFCPNEVFEAQGEALRALSSAHQPPRSRGRGHPSLTCENPHFPRWHLSSGWTSRTSCTTAS